MNRRHSRLGICRWVLIACGLCRPIVWREQPRSPGQGKVETISPMRDRWRDANGRCCRGYSRCCCLFFPSEVWICNTVRASPAAGGRRYLAPPGRLNDLTRTSLARSARTSSSGGATDVLSSTPGQPSSPPPHSSKLPSSPRSIYPDSRPVTATATAIPPVLAAHHSTLHPPLPDEQPCILLHFLASSPSSQRVGSERHPSTRPASLCPSR